MSQRAQSLLVRTAVIIAILGVGTIALQFKNYRGVTRTVTIPQPRTGREVVMVFIASTDCGPSKRPGFNNVIRQAATNLSLSARRQGMAFSRVGVVLTGSSLEGAKFLSDFGPFDELVSGRGWMNSGAIAYIWRDIPGSSAVPQLLVLERRISVSPRGIIVSPDSVVFRITGVDQIRSWTNAGSPIT